jgi:hypothetical protein
MKRLLLAVALATSALSGCAQLTQWCHDAEALPHAGGSALEEQRPYPTHFRNDHYYAP